jgi:type VII secretion protein EccB
MATKKDLVEAYSFSRRRLVTAFVSGAPGGREVEPARPGRTIVGGLALAVLLIAGAAIAGIFSPKVPDDWTEPGLIVSKEDGNPYVITEDESADEGDPPVLRPVINITSAKLILGENSEPRIVPQSAIDEQIVGEDIGILGAPATVPSPSQLIETGWTACTNEGEGVRVTISTEPGVVADERGGYIVSNEGLYYVIAVSEQEDDPIPRARAYSYLLPKNGSSRDNILAELGLGSVADDATEVSKDWLSLFPQGAPLDIDSFGLDGAGQPPVTGDTGIPEDAVVGDVLETDTGDLLVTKTGPAPLTPFAQAVYENLPGAPTPMDQDGPLGARASSPYAGNHWPASLPKPIDEQPCAVLRAESGEAPAVVPGHLSEDAEVSATSSGVEAGEKSQGVQPGRGAYVLVGEWTDTNQGLPYLIDTKGKAYTLVGAGAADQLGYASEPHPVVPDSWVALFEEGVPLSRDAALCEPSPVPGVTC